MTQGLSQVRCPNCRSPVQAMIEQRSFRPTLLTALEQHKLQPADLTLFSTDHAWTFRAADSASKSRNTPFDGRAFKGAPMVTIVAGRVVYRREA